MRQVGTSSCAVRTLKKNKTHLFRPHELIWILYPDNLLPRRDAGHFPACHCRIIRKKKKSDKSLDIVRNSGLSHEARIRIAFPKLKALMGQPGCAVICKRWGSFILQRLLAEASWPDWLWHIPGSFQCRVSRGHFHTLQHFTVDGHLKSKKKQVHKWQQQKGQAWQVSDIWAWSSSGCVCEMNL